MWDVVLSDSDKSGLIGVLGTVVGSVVTGWFSLRGVRLGRRAEVVERVLDGLQQHREATHAPGPFVKPRDLATLVQLSGIVTRHRWRQAVNAYQQACKNTRQDEYGQVLQADPVAVLAAIERLERMLGTS